MSNEPRFAMRSFPSRIADLGFAIPLPPEWLAHDVPVEQVDFSDATALFPLAFVSAPHAAIIMAIAARPAFDDGTLQDWALYLLSHHQLRPHALSVRNLGALQAIVGEATQESEVGPLLVRFAFCEDGGRLINLSLTAPEMLAGAVADVWSVALEGFRLDSPRGSTAAIGAGAGIMPTESAAPAAAEDEVAGAADDAGDLDALVAANEDEPSPADASDIDEGDPAAGEFAVFALAADTASLDPDHPINANLRDRGVGLVPRVVATDDGARRATVAAGAISANFAVPFGWHVIDDGRRTLVFEPSGAVQINLDLVPRAGRSRAAILDAIEAEMRSSYAEPEFVRIESGPITALGARNIHDGAEPIEQYHLLIDRTGGDAVLRARVTAAPDHAASACNLAGSILLSAERPAAPPQRPARDDRPAWLRRACELEAEDRLEEAEATINAAVQHIGAAASIAEMYAARMRRLQAQGEEDRALAAREMAEQWIRFYASQATSGGEGAALSLERDQFLTQL